MPLVGEVIKGSLLGKTQTGKFIWQKCCDCGKERWVELRADRPLIQRCSFCNRLFQRGEHTSQWSGGRRTTQQGYVLVLLSKDDFFFAMANCSGYVFEHRLVMAKHLNRCLLSWEVVHHKNGIKDDNRLENLELLPHGRFHLVDIRLKAENKFLKKRIAKLEHEIKSLKGGLKVKQYQHGDVLLRQIKQLPANVKVIERRNGRLILAEGEATGHHHAIAEKGAFLYELKGDLYIEATEPVTITHDEHKAIPIPPGIYQIGIVREHDYFADMERRVVD